MSSRATVTSTSAMGVAMDEPAIRTIAMPRDTNPAGDVFGGWLMAQMDLAAGVVAARHAHGRCATVRVDAMEFERPVHVGDEVSLYASLAAVGRTSMTIRVEAWRRVRTGEEHEQVTAAVFVYVALDEEGRPDRQRAAPGAAAGVEVEVEVGRPPAAVVERPGRADARQGAAAGRPHGDGAVGAALD